MKGESAANHAARGNASGHVAFLNQPQATPVSAKDSIPRLFEEGFGPPDSIRVASRARRKLWELPRNLHCPLVGTCLTIADLRKLAKRCGIPDPAMPDYELHTIVVNHCMDRTTVAEQIQRVLDERHALAIRQFSKAKSGDVILALWRKAVTEGNIPGSLWAAWTHAETDEKARLNIYGDLHMLSHQLGAQERMERKHLLVLEEDHARLREEAAVLRLNLVAAQREQARLEACLAECDRQAAQFKRDELALAGAKQIEITNNTLRERNEALAQRISTLGKRNADQASRIADLEKQRVQACNTPGATETASDPAPDTALAGLSRGGPDQPADSRLAGRRVLCIGGRTGLIDHYHRLVEASGGHFIHHDGGQENNEHRIDDIVAGADAVVCQIRHVSHAAYQRIKLACKQRGLPCFFPNSSGVTTFARNLEMLVDEKLGD